MSIDAAYLADLLRPFGGKMPLCPLCDKLCEVEDGPECSMDDYMPTKVIACPDHGEVPPPRSA